MRGFGAGGKWGVDERSSGGRGRANTYAHKAQPMRMMENALSAFSFNDSDTRHGEETYGESRRARARLKK